MMRKKLSLLGPVVLSLSLALACGQASSPVPPQTPAVSVQAGPGSVTVEEGRVAAQGEAGSVTVQSGSVATRGEAGSATVQPGSVEARGEGGSVTVDEGAAAVRGDGGSVTVGGGSLSVQGEGGNITVGGGGVQVPGVDLSGVPGMGSVDVGAAVDVGTYLQGLERIDLPEITMAGVEVRQGGGRTIYFVSGDVLFDFDKADLRPDAKAALQQVARSLQDRHAGSRVLVEGYTDAKGSDAYNQELSLRRAQAVKKWMAGPGGLSAAEMEVKGRGEANPVAPNARPDGSDDPAGRQKNRRVEISVPD